MASFSELKESLIDKNRKYIITGSIDNDSDVFPYSNKHGAKDIFEFKRRNSKIHKYVKHISTEVPIDITQDNSNNIIALRFPVRDFADVAKKYDDQTEYSTEEKDALKTIRSLQTIVWAPEQMSPTDEALPVVFYFVGDGSKPHRSFEEVEMRDLYQIDGVPPTLTYAQYYGFVIIFVYDVRSVPHSATLHSVNGIPSGGLLDIYFTDTLRNESDRVRTLLEQDSNATYTYAHDDYFLEYLDKLNSISNFKVDVSNVFLTGHSAGGTCLRDLLEADALRGGPRRYKGLANFFGRWRQRMIDHTLNSDPAFKLFIAIGENDQSGINRYDSRDENEPDFWEGVKADGSYNSVYFNREVVYVNDNIPYELQYRRPNGMADNHGASGMDWSSTTIDDGWADTKANYEIYTLSNDTVNNGHKMHLMYIEGHGHGIPGLDYRYHMSPTGSIEYGPLSQEISVLKLMYQIFDS